MKLQEISPFVRYVRYLKLEQNTYFPPFIPVDARLFYVCKGKGIIEIENNVIEILEGQILYINSGVKYSHKPCEVSYLAVNFDFTNNFSHLEMPINNIDPLETENYSVLEKVSFEDAPFFNDYHLFKNCRSIFDEVSQLEKEYMRKLPFYRVKTSALLISVLSFLARNSESTDTKSDTFNVKEVVSFIQKHYNEPISNSYLAELFHYHPNYLSAEFKNTMGVPIHKYILEMRIIKASSMIESGYRNLSEISEKCGFSDVNYFSRYFKKVFGIPPSKFAKNF